MTRMPRRRWRRRSTTSSATPRRRRRPGTEKAFAAGFASMWGNVKLLMSTIGMAVVFAILLVTANAMMMNQRERTSEVAVMKTVGFSDRRGVRPGHHRGRRHLAHRCRARTRRRDAAPDRDGLRRRWIPAGIPRHAAAHWSWARPSRSSSPWRAASSRRGRRRSCPWCRHCGGSNEDPVRLQRAERDAAAGLDGAHRARHRARRGGVRCDARARERIRRCAREDRFDGQRAPAAPRSGQRDVERHSARSDQHHQRVAAHRHGRGRASR